MSEPEEKRRKEEVGADAEEEEESSSSSSRDDWRNEHKPFKSESACFVPSRASLLVCVVRVSQVSAVDGWTEEEKTLLAVHEHRVVAGSDFKVSKAAIQTTLASADVASLPPKVKSALAQSLAKYLRRDRDDGAFNGDVCDCMSYAARVAPASQRVALLELMTRTEELSDFIREWAREWLFVIRRPDLFPAAVVARIFDSSTDFARHSSYINLPIDVLPKFNLIVDNIVSSELLDISSPYVRGYAFEFVLDFFEDRVIGAADLTLMRRLFRMVEECDQDSPSGRAFTMFTSRYVMTCVEIAIEEEFGAFLCEVLSNPLVDRSVLHEMLCRLMVYCPDDDGTYRVHGFFPCCVFLTRQLFLCGLSPLVRDPSGVLLAANVRAGKWRFVGKIGRLYYMTLLDWEPEETAAMSALIREFTPRKWRPDNHRLFPADVRLRIRTLLLCNGRLREDGAVWLPYDPLELLIQWLAVAEVLGEDAIEADVARLQVGELVRDYIE